MFFFLPGFPGLGQSAVRGSRCTTMPQDALDFFQLVIHTSSDALHTSCQDLQGTGQPKSLDNEK